MAATLQQINVRINKHVPHRIHPIRPMLNRMFETKFSSDQIRICLENWELILPIYKDRIGGKSFEEIENEIKAYCSELYQNYAPSLLNCFIPLVHQCINPSCSKNDLGNPIPYHDVIIFCCSERLKKGTMFIKKCSKCSYKYFYNYYIRPGRQKMLTIHPDDEIFFIFSYYGYEKRLLMQNDSDILFKHTGFSSFTNAFNHLNFKFDKEETNIMNRFHLQKTWFLWRLGHFCANENFRMPVPDQQGFHTTLLDLLPFIQELFTKKWGKIDYHAFCRDGTIREVKVGCSATPAYKSKKCQEHLSTDENDEGSHSNNNLVRTHRHRRARARRQQFKFNLRCKTQIEKKRQLAQAALVASSLYGEYKIIGDLFRGSNDDIIHCLDECEYFHKHQEKLNDILTTSILSLEDNNLVMLKSFKSLFDNANTTRSLIHILLKMSLREQKAFTGWAKFSLKTEMRRHYEQMINAFSRVANHDLKLEMFSPEQRAFIHGFLWNRVRSNVPVNFSAPLTQFVSNLLVQQILSFAQTDVDDTPIKNETIDLDSILPRIVGHIRIENFFGIPTNISNRKIDLYNITRLPLFTDETKAVYTANLPTLLSLSQDGSSSEWSDYKERKCTVDEKSNYMFCAVPVPVFSSIQNPCLRSTVLNDSTKDCLKEIVDMPSPQVVKFANNIHAVSVYAPLQCFEKGDKENKNIFSNVTKVAIIKTCCNSFVSCGVLDFSSFGSVCGKTENYLFSFSRTHNQLNDSPLDINIIAPPFTEKDHGNTHSYRTKTNRKQLYPFLSSVGVTESSPNQRSKLVKTVQQKPNPLPRRIYDYMQNLTDSESHQLSITSEEFFEEDFKSED
ncbi:unnamed protein product [Rotaria socialis]|uniref:CxC5 like cysteine cluster associated with KDZ domain-containing protein n=1 Tax=Rotaria socialis TaxID=392032 RepID=A0A821E670_9BILA|nr:unnamed protein product [Rotaria socialis]